MFELSDDTNPNNLEQQMSQAMATTRAAFDQMRKIIEQRESDLLREIEKEFGAKTELLDNEVKGIADVIEKGENITKEYAMASSAKKDAKLLRRLFEMEAETKKLMGTAEKIEKSPLAQTTTKVILEGCEEIAESLKGLGRVVGTANIPAPSNFRAADSRCGYIVLSWDKSEGCTTYQVTAKKTADPDSAWTEIYNGPDTRASCFNTEVCTSYMFKVTPMYNGTKSANSSTCTGQTVNELNELFCNEIICFRMYKKSAYINFSLLNHSHFVTRFKARTNKKSATCLVVLTLLSLSHSL